MVVRFDGRCDDLLETTTMTAAAATANATSTDKAARLRARRRRHAARRTSRSNVDSTLGAP